MLITIPCGLFLGPANNGAGLALGMNIANGVRERTAPSDTGSAETAACTARTTGATSAKATAILKGTLDTEDDAHAHGCGENACHAGDNRFNGVCRVCGGDNEVEENVGKVDEEDSAVEVEVVAKHETPGVERLGSQGLDGAHNRESEGGRVEDGRGEPIDTDPALVVKRASNAALTVKEMDGAVEATADGGDNTLDKQEGEEQPTNIGCMVVNGGDTDNVDGGSSKKQDGCANGLIGPEAATVWVL